jgi:hypothetical protein
MEIFRPPPSAPHRQNLPTYREAENLFGEHAHVRPVGLDARETRNLIRRSRPITM